MTSRFLILAALSTFVMASAKAESLPKTLETTLSQLAQKDIEGNATCFSGEVKKFSDQMSENYGGRFSGSFTLSGVLLAQTQYRQIAKYCDGYADKHGKTITDETQFESAPYKICEHTNTSSYAVSVLFAASTSGTLEDESVLFKVAHDVTTTLIVKKSASYDPKPSDIFLKKVTTALKCNLLPTN